MSHNYSFPDFMHYCSASNESMRAERDVFWYNRIPVPAVLVKKIFFSSDRFLNIYSQHLLAATMLALHDLGNPQRSSVFGFFPDTERVKDYKIGGHLSEIWDYCQGISSYKKFESKLSEFIGCGRFELGYTDFESILSHKGKKYERLYYPRSVKKLMTDSFPKVLDLLKGGNGDFFGNVIADELKIYRSGFGDAFAALFNRYLDFKFEYFPNLDPRIALQGQMAEFTLKSMGTIKRVDYAEGYLWNPLFQQGGVIGVEMDCNHPLLDVAQDKQLSLLLLALSKEEMSVFNTNVKSVLEDYRFRVSQTLKTYIEEQ